jgi:hypothetical protein
MTQYSFGTGTLICKRTDLTLQQPALLGVLQDISVDFDRKIEELVGQYNVAVAIAGGQLSIKGKAKFARLQATHFNNLFLGQSMTTPAMLEMTTGESGTVSGGAITVANGATFVEDLGVFNASTGVQLTPVASSPAAGTSYVAGAAGVGAYSFHTGDNGTAYLIYYTYTTTSSGSKIVAANQLMGPIPVFELHFKESFTVGGVAKDIILKLNACSASKLSLPFSNTKFTIPEFEFSAFADSSNNWGTLSFSE